MSKPEDILYNWQVEQACAGDSEAFTALFCRHQFGIYGYLTGLVGNSEDAHDLTQDTFFKAWEQLPSLQDPSKFRSWLYTIARNLAYDQGRHKKKISWNSYEEVNEEYFAADQADPGEQVAQKELIILTLAQLPLKYRECLLLQVEGGLSRHQIAEVTGISQESVSTYLCSARKKFRELYRRQENEQDITETGESVR